MVIIYVVLQSVSLLLIWAFIIWRLCVGIIIPEIAAYPPIDFATKLIDRESSALGRPLLDEEKEELREADSVDTLKMLKEAVLIRCEGAPNAEGMRNGATTAFCSPYLNRHSPNAGAITSRL